MKPLAAIIEPASDIAQLARDIAREHIALQDCERKLDESERKTEGLREQQRRHRVEIGRMLVEAKRAIKHGGWLPYLEKLGINEQSARNWMALAGYVETKSQTRPDVLDLPTPTLADAGIDRRPRKSTPRADEQPDPQPRHEAPRAPSLDIDAELLGIHQKIMAHAKTWPANARSALAHELREMAALIEEMQDD